MSGSSPPPLSSPALSMNSTAITLRIANSVRHRSRRAREMVWWHSPAGRRTTEQLSALRNSSRGQRCFILGNGPTLQATDIRRLGSEVTIASNAIFLLFGETGFTPTYLTVEDRLVAEDRADELNSLTAPRKVFPRDLAYCLKPDQSTVYINFIREYTGFPKFSPDVSKVAYWGGTVSFLNLQLAHHLGCNPIYLIGFDHNYKLSSADHRDGSVITSHGADPNHFHPDYFGAGYRWHDPEVERMEAAYIEAREFLSEQGTSVFNATAGGSLNVFERVDFEQLWDVQ